MKSRHIYLRVFLCLFIPLLGTIQVKGNNDYYAQVTAHAIGPTGAGTVYATTGGENASNGTEGNESTARGSTTTIGGDVSFTFTATPTGIYDFKGWSTTNNVNATLASTSNTYKKNYSASSTKDGIQSHDIYAIFAEKPLFYFSGIAIASPSDAGTTSVIPEGGTSVRGERWNSTSATTSTIAFSATPSSDYLFLGWSTSASGSIERTDNPYNPTLTSTSTNSGSPTNTTLYARFQPYATSITASPSELIAYVGRPSSPISHTVSPSGAYDEHTTYESNNTSIATVDASGVVTGVAIGETTITIKSLKDDNSTVAATTSINVIVKNKVATPNINIVSNETDNGATATVTITCDTPSASIYYTVNGSNPTTSSTLYQGPFTVNGLDEIRAYAVNLTDDKWDPSDVAHAIYSLCTTEKPQITYEGNSTTGKATVTITTETGSAIYYTTNGNDPTTSTYAGTGTTTVTINNVDCGTTVKAIAKSSTCQVSMVESKDIIFSNVSGGKVLLNDYEDHTWTYYSGIDVSVDGGNYNTNYNGKMYSPNPRNVKITYNGVNGISGSTTTVQVSRSESETSFVYYKTLEEGSTSGEYPYQVISNPFSVRPSTGNGNSKVYYGFAGWKIVSGGEYIKNHSNNDVLGLDEEIVFNNLPYPSVNCTSAEIVFQTTWTQANVQTGNDISTMLNSFSGGTYETNFAVLTGQYTTAWTGNKNATISSVYPDGSTDARANNVYTYLNVTVNSGYTIKYEYININNNNTTLSMGNGTKTLYVGRGVSNTTTNGVVCNLIQGYGDSNITGGLGYTLKIESGVYNYLSFIKGYDGGPTDNTVTGTVSVKGVLGCDYDRAKEDNTKLKIQEQIFMGYANNTALLKSTTAGQEVLNVTLKSGSLNSNMTSAGIADAKESFYIGIAGQYSAGYRVFNMEGGEMWSLAAGLCQNTSTTNSIRFRIKGGLIKGSIYGSAANANSYGYKQMIITGGTIRGWIAGGGNGTSANGGTTTGSSYIYVGGNARVDSEGSTTKINSSLGGQVFGSGSGVDGSTTWGEMLYGSNVVIADNAYIERNVFGGGNFGWTDEYANIYLTGEGMSVGNVYGGANQNKGDSVRIYMTGGTVREGLYGGSNTTGTINYNVEMHINGGQVGTSSTSANIHGGGYGSSTIVSGNVDLTLGIQGQTTSGVTVYGDVYGGSALGSVNGTSATTSYHTNVTLNKGIINGSLYGGALGATGTAANVYGPVKVTVNGGSVRKTDANGANGSGAVYGCNNVNGAPQWAVEVIVNGTDPAPAENEYALYAVYGGGNAANYTFGTPTVTVNNCDNSIEYVYGGANAADVPSSDVTVWGGTIGHVFGGGHGDKDANPQKAANVNGDVAVKIYGGTITEVFGGSNSKGNITGSSTVTIKDNGGTCPFNITDVYGGGNQAAGNAGALSIGCGAVITGNVYGGAKEANVNNSISLNITGGTLHNVFGGNNIGGSISGTITVNINQDNSCSTWHLDNVYGGGNLVAYSHSGSYPLVNIKNGAITGNVFGGGLGESAVVTSNPIVNITGGNIGGDVYGGGDAASVNGNTTVNLLGGTISGDVYGGGKGSSEVAASVGNAKVNLNGLESSDYVADYHSTLVTAANENGVSYYALNSGITGCVVNRIFGCNNVNGSPTGTATVHVFKTQGDATHTKTDPAKLTSTTASDHSYEVRAVYGGGNMAEYVPTDLTNGKTNVIIDGCELTSIETVYGGGNAASTPATNVTINGTYEIGEVFGGGNGKDEIAPGVANPGANVGYHAYEDNATNAQTAADRIANYQYGSGKAQVNIYGGTIHAVYGGSNTKGNVREVAVAMLASESGCEFNVDEAYGGGKSAAMDGRAILEMKCIPGIATAYGGSRNADVNNDVTLNITNGTFDQVFGGNNEGGRILGSITVNIEETGCNPIKIGELYGGGNMACYSIYGYKDVDDNGQTQTDAYGNKKWFPRRSSTDSGTGPSTAYSHPQVNVKSFASIGKIFGGGLGTTAVMVGNPTVNVNEVVGDKASVDAAEVTESNNSINGIEIPTHEKGKIGAIGAIFGGGNAAMVIGNTNVNIGTAATIDYVTKAENESTARTGIPVKGVDIRGNIYGGGNDAKVDGDANVQIGK